MPKRKKKIVSLEVLEVNSTWDYRKTRVLRNFICNEEDAEKTVADMDLQELWKHEHNYNKEVKAILSPSGTRNASCCFYGDDVAYEEVKLPSSMKTIPQYVYKVYDYFDDKLNTEYGTQKDILAYVNKKIKVKYVYVTYNGRTERIEYATKSIGDLLSKLEETTSQLEIEPCTRSGSTDDTLIISSFKNCVK